MSALDHIVIATPDLDLGKQSFFDATGVMPGDGGPHPGGGTRNALAAFSGEHYIELIAPDPEQDLTGTLGEYLKTLHEPELLHWAVRASGLKDLAADFDSRGIPHSQPRRMSRTLPAGGTLEWELMNVGPHGQGGVVPFYIDWLECEHPSKTSEMVGDLSAFRVSVPAASFAAKVLAPPPDNVQVVTGEEAVLLEFDSPKGTVRYEVAAPQGFPLR